MAIETVGVEAIAMTGEHVPTPEHADPSSWAEFVGQVAIVPGGCHIWLGMLWGECGYGRIRVTRPPAQRITTLPHRYAWAARHGWPDDDDDRHVLHACDERLCAPVTAEALAEHLHLGDAQDNALERTSRGRAGSTRHAVRRRSADIRPRRVRSLEMQVALRQAVRMELPPEALVEVVEMVCENGNPHPGQIVLPEFVPERRLRLVHSRG